MYDTHKNAFNSNEADYSGHHIKYEKIKDTWTEGSFSNFISLRYIFSQVNIKCIMQLVYSNTCNCIFLSGLYHCVIFILSCHAAVLRSSPPHSKHDYHYLIVIFPLTDNPLSYTEHSPRVVEPKTPQSGSEPPLLPVEVSPDVSINVEDGNNNNK